MNLIVNQALNPVLNLVSKCLSMRGARALAGLRADRKSQKRLEELANKNTEGDLTPEEHAEYEGYVFANNVMAILQAKARARLRKRRGKAT